MSDTVFNFENPYRAKLQELCSIPNPYRPEPACREGTKPKDEFFLVNPYRTSELLPRPRFPKTSFKFDIPNPYR